MRYPTTTIVALLGVLGLVVAAALYLGGDTEGAQRFGILVGIATVIVNGLLTQRDTEQTKNIAQESKVTLDRGVELEAHVAAAQAELLRATGNASILRRQLQEKATAVINHDTESSMPSGMEHGRVDR